jgi:hypothetical protein
MIAALGWMMPALFGAALMAAIAALVLDWGGYASRRQTRYPPQPVAEALRILSLALVAVTGGGPLSALVVMRAELGSPLRLIGQTARLRTGPSRDGWLRTTAVLSGRISVPPFGRE